MRTTQRSLTTTVPTALILGTLKKSKLITDKTSGTAATCAIGITWERSEAPNRIQHLTLPQTKRLSKLRVQLKRFSFFLFAPHLVCQTMTIYAWHVKDPQRTLFSSLNANSRSTDSLRPLRHPVPLVGLWEGANRANFLISWCQLLCPTRRQSPRHTRPSPP